MLSNSRSALWSRTSVCTIALAALTVSSAFAVERAQSRGVRPGPGLDRTLVGTPGSAAGQQMLSAGPESYQARLLDANGAPVTGVIMIHASNGTVISRVRPNADGIFRVVGNAGDIFGLSASNFAVKTTNEASVKILLPGSSAGVIDVTLPRAGGSNPVSHGVGGLGQVGPNIGGSNVVMQGGTSCATPATLVIGSGDTGSTVGATAGFGGAPNCGSVAAGGPNVWYSFVGTGTNVNIRLCGSSYDTALTLWKKCTDCGAALTCVSTNDDSCGLQSQLLNICTVAGENYILAVGGFGGQSGNYVLATDAGAACTGTACPPPPQPTGSCCVSIPPPFPQGSVPVTCSILTAADCAAAGGVYNGDDVPCVTGDLAFNEYDDGTFPAGLGILIPDGTGPLPSPGPSVIRTINVASPGSTLDVNVEIDVLTVFNGDFNIYLHHNSVVNRLWNNVCGFVGLHYTSDDDGTEIFCAPIATGQGDTDGDGWNSDLPRNDPDTGMFPVNTGNRLQDYEGLPVNGAWDFEILDNWQFYQGVLQHWGLELTSLANPVNACADFNCPVCPACDSCCGDPCPTGGHGHGNGH